MNLIVALEHRFIQTPDNQVWSKGPVSYEFWSRYLDVFDKVFILARTKMEERRPDISKQVTGKNVFMLPLLHYIGPAEYIIKKRLIMRQIESYIKLEAAIILRAGPQIGRLVYKAINHKSRPFAVEVVGNPYQVFSSSAVRHPGRILFRYYFDIWQKKLCNEACAISYVTEYSLQNRYPPNRKAYTTYYSDVMLGNADIIDKPRLHQTKKEWNLVFIGSLDQMYKGVDVLIRSTLIVKNRGLKIKVAIIGDGKYKSELMSYARKCEIQDYIEFKGQIRSGSDILDELDNADLFVLPSKTEGLPRALLEAMARGLPCIASNVGGIPELLNQDDLVDPGDFEMLAKKIYDVLNQPERLNIMSQRNYEKAKKYTEEKLIKRRNDFYDVIKRVTSERLNCE